MDIGIESSVQNYENDNDDDPERLFLNSIKSNATKHMYLTCLQRYLNFANCKTIGDLIAEIQGSKGH